VVAAENVAVPLRTVVSVELNEPSKNGARKVMRSTVLAVRST
jgi:hypothetical protein